MWTGKGEGKYFYPRVKGNQLIVQFMKAKKITNVTCGKTFFAVGNLKKHINSVQMVKKITTVTLVESHLLNQVS